MSVKIANTITELHEYENTQSKVERTTNARQNGPLYFPSYGVSVSTVHSQHRKIRPVEAVIFT